MGEGGRVRGCVAILVCVDFCQDVGVVGESLFSGGDREVGGDRPG